MTDLSLGRHVAKNKIIADHSASPDINPHAVTGAEILIEQLYKFYAEVKVLEDLNLISP